MQQDKKQNLENSVSVAYKVVTSDMRSLGLRKNPNILTYPVGEWYVLPEKDVVAGKDDFGGIWVTRRFSDAKKLVRYMSDKYSIDARIFRARASSRQRTCA
jgi:hypothetical protein